MRLEKAVHKLFRETITVYNPTTGVWDTPALKANLANSGRWISRMEDFYDRRVLLTSEPIDPQYQVGKIAGGNATYLIYGNVPDGQANIKAGQGYLYEYMLFNAETSPVELIAYQGTQAASGMLAGQAATSLGFFPMALGRYASATDSDVPNVTQSKFNCFMPSYAGAQKQMEVIWNNEYYVIQEVSLELNLTHAHCIKR